MQFSAKITTMFTDSTLFKFHLDYSALIVCISVKMFLFKYKSVKNALLLTGSLN